MTRQLFCCPLCLYLNWLRVENHLVVTWTCVCLITVSSLHCIRWCNYCYFTCHQKIEPVCLFPRHLVYMTICLCENVTKRARRRTRRRRIKENTIKEREREQKDIHQEVRPFTHHGDEHIYKYICNCSWQESKKSPDLKCTPCTYRQGIHTLVDTHTTTHTNTREVTLSNWGGKNLRTFDHSILKKQQDKHCHVVCKEEALHHEDMSKKKDRKREREIIFLFSLSFYLRQLMQCNFNAITWNR